MSGIADASLLAIMAALREAATAEILPRFSALTAADIRTKSGPDDLVTDADVGAERFLTERLGDALAPDCIIGEEAVAADPGLLAKIGGSGVAVIIDPVDGTWNFANGLPLFGSIVALVVEGETQIGAIHFPLTGDYVVAKRGSGAWRVDASGCWSALRVTPAPSLNAMSGLVPLHLFERAETARMAPRVAAFGKTTTYRCSAYEYRLIAQNSMTFSLNAGLMPWDHAAGALIYAEAGGFSALTTGEAYRPQMTEGHLLLAPDKASWQAIRHAMFA